MGKAGRRLSLRSGSALNVGKWGKQGEDFPYVFIARTKCREMGKRGRRLFLRSVSALNVGK